MRVADHIVVWVVIGLLGSMLVLSGFLVGTFFGAEQSVKSADSACQKHGQYTTREHTMSCAKNK